MKSQINQCIQCGTEYTYISSAYGGIPDAELNDHKYCPDCKKIINDALKKVKKKFIDKWVDASNEVTLSQLLSLEQHEVKCNKDMTNSFVFRKVYPGLYDLNGDSTYSRDIKLNNITYHLSTWEHNPEYTISKSVRWSVALDKAVDGKEYISSKKLIDESKVESYEYYKITHSSNNEIKVIPLTEPIGLNFALKFLSGGT